MSLRADQGVRSARRVGVDLSGVAESVLWTTYQRSVEARRPDAVLDDPKVIELVDRIDYPFEQRFGGRGFGQWQALRARCLDREARAVPRPAPGRYGGGARRGSRNPVLAGRQRARPLAERGCAGTARSRDGRSCSSLLPASRRSPSSSWPSSFAAEVQTKSTPAASRSPEQARPTASNHSDRWPTRCVKQWSSRRLTSAIAALLVVPKSQRRLPARSTPVG